MKKKILVIADYYLPGYKGGGPIRTIANTVDWLGDEFEFYIITRDRDLGDDQPYDSTEYDCWVQTGTAKVLYLSPQQTKLSALSDILRQQDYDLLYLNSVFGVIDVKIMLLRLLRRIPQKPLLIAPRGEFHPGALGIKMFKKRIYLFLSKLLQTYKNVIWQASTPEEESNILSVFPSAKDRVMIARNLPARALPPLSDIENCHKNDITKIVFLSRISPKKNLTYVLQLLQNIADKIQFDIYGTMEDTVYWHECQTIIDALPSNVQVEYKGELHPDNVVPTLSQYHLFLFPTLGENYGHVIWEALYAGCPVLISDQTPWRDLEEKGIGWDLPLDSPQEFVNVIENVIAMDGDTYKKHAHAAHQYAKQKAHDENVIEANRQLFHAAMEI